MSLDTRAKRTQQYELDLTCFANDEFSDTISFYQIEGDLLSLWDRLNEFKLEKALVEAYQATESNIDVEEIDSALEQAQKECLRAKAEYLLRQSVIEDTIIAGPILNAIHSGDKANGPERTLTPLIYRRDVLAMASNNLVTTLQASNEGNRQTQIERASQLRKTRELASKAFELAAGVHAAKNNIGDEPSLVTQFEAYEHDISTTARQLKVMKGVVAAVIAGSGVDWASDAELNALVLETEDPAE